MSALRMGLPGTETTQSKATGVFGLRELFAQGWFASAALRSAITVERGAAGFWTSQLTAPNARSGRNLEKRPRGLITAPGARPRRLDTGPGTQPPRGHLPQRA